MHTEEHARQTFDRWAESGKIESDEIGRSDDRFDALRSLCTALIGSKAQMGPEIAHKIWGTDKTVSYSTYGNAARAVIEVMDLVLAEDGWLDKGREIMAMVSETTVE